MQTIETAAEELLLAWLHEYADGERVLERIRSVAQDITDAATMALNDCREDLVATQWESVKIAQSTLDEARRLDEDDFIDRTVGEIIEALRTKHTRAVCRLAMDLLLPNDTALRGQIERSPYFSDCKTEVFRVGESFDALTDPAGETIRLLSEAFTRMAWSCIRDARE